MSSKLICRSCGAAIMWAITDKGRRIPLDVKPVENGNIALVDRGVLLYPLAQYVKPNTSVLRHVSHFSTCKDAKKWRRNR